MKKQIKFFFLILIIILIVLLCIFINYKFIGFENINENAVKINMPFGKTMTYLNHPNYGNIICYDESELISNHLLKNDIWENNICEIMADNYVPNTDILDIGANLGLNSIRMNQIKPITGKIHLFEPQPDTFLMMKFKKA